MWVQIFCLIQEHLNFACAVKAPGAMILNHKGTICLVFLCMIDYDMAFDIPKSYISIISSTES